MNKERAVAYRADIDGLRSLAVMLVLVFHFKIFSLGKGGFLGVDIFFVISGYLITSIIWSELQRGTFNFKDFYIKRIRRLFPALIVVVFFCIGFGMIVLLPSEFEELSKQVIFTQLYSSNFYFWQNLNYFGLSAGSSVLLHTWSLAVEEQFYLFFPIVFFFLYKYQRNFIVYWFIAGAIFSFFLNLYFVERKPELTFYLMPTRAWELLAGSLLVFLLKRKSIFALGRVSWGLSFLGFSCIFFSVLFYGSEINFPGSYALFPVVGTMLLIFSGCSKSSLSYRFLSNSVLVYVGKISYPLYLVHWPINVFASMMLADGYSLFWRLCMLALTFFISILIYHFIESPIRSGQVLKKRNHYFAHYLVSVALTVFLSIYFVGSGGAPWRFSKESVYFESFSSDSAPDDYSSCSYDDGNAYIDSRGFCVLGDRTRPPSWILVGDSHALAASAALDLWLKDRGKSGYFLFRRNCPPLFGLDIFRSKGKCYRYNEKVYQFISENDQIKNAILASAWIQAKEGILTFDSKVRLNVKGSIEFFNERLSHSLGLLNEVDVDAYIWAPVPGAKAHVPNSLARAKNISRALGIIEKSRDEYLEEFDFFYNWANANDDKKFTLIPVYDELCKSGVCSVLVDNVPLYFDSHHISYSSREYWAKIIARSLDNSAGTSK